jgi:16S rRNA (guanine527-N7)-methyltransferase
VTITKNLFEPYLQELNRWNKSINLVQADTVKNAWQRHFEDSLQLSKFIPQTSQHIVDIGSGAGFPGMVLAIHCQKKVSLIEPVKKKAVFLNQINNLYNSPAIILDQKWQEITIHNADVITSRAFASLKNILEAMEYVSRETKNALGLFLKGEKLLEEIAEAKQFWEFDYEIHQSSTHKDGKIIRVTGLKRK